MRSRIAIFVHNLIADIRGTKPVSCDGCRDQLAFLNAASADTWLCDTCLESVMMFGKYPHELDPKQKRELVTKMGGFVE